MFVQKKNFDLEPLFSGERAVTFLSYVIYIIVFFFSEATHLLRELYKHINSAAKFRGII